MESKKAPDSVFLSVEIDGALDSMEHVDLLRDHRRETNVRVIGVGSTRAATESSVERSSR